uniref:Oligomycin sensitivity conferral protein n=1 Tax=Salmo trutta TaxID=8032 RepID=A0A673XCA0_SALTR
MSILSLYTDLRLLCQIHRPHERRICTTTRDKDSSWKLALSTFKKWYQHDTGKRYEDQCNVVKVLSRHVARYTTSAEYSRKRARASSALPRRVSLIEVRQFSTSVLRQALIRPPIDVYGVGGRYATALFSAASKQKKLEQVEKEMRTLSALIKDPKLSSIVMNPHVKRSLKLKFFGDAMTKANLSPITVNLITVLADNGRLTLTADVVGAFAKMMSAHRGEVICTVTTAHPLDEANLTELKVALNGFLAKGETLILETKSDASILGGMIVSIGDKYVDMSTKTKIHKLTKIIRDS